MEDLVRRMQERLKGIKPEVALVTWTTNAGRFGHFLSIPRNMPARMNLLLDAPDQEFWLDETNRGTTIVPAFANAYIWATTNHRVAFSEPYIMSHGNPYGKDSFPPHEILRRMMLAVTYGAQPSIAVGQPARLQEQLYDCLDEVQRRKPWLTHKRPEPWAALVMSDNTRNFYGRSAGLVEERYMADVFGAFRAARRRASAGDGHQRLEPERRRPGSLQGAGPAQHGLSRRRPSGRGRCVRAAGRRTGRQPRCLAVRRVGQPARQLRPGRNVWASTIGACPRRRPDATEELDVNFAKSIGPDYWEKRKNVFDFQQEPTSLLNQGKMQTYVGAEPVTFKGPAVRVAPRPGANVIGTLRAKSVVDAAEFPGVVTHEHGQGRVVYFAGGFDAGYYLYPYPYQRLALVNAVRWAAAESAPVAVEAPMCVHSQVMRQTRDGQRLVVHLFNDLNTTGQHAFASDDVPLREETVPIRDIRVRFDRRYRLGASSSGARRHDIEAAVTPEGTTVVVPQLDVHAMVVAELSPDGR